MADQPTSGEQLYEYTVTLVGPPTEYGVSLEALAAGQVSPPPEGARFDGHFEGASTSGRLKGRLVGIDYLQIRADGRFDLHIHATITTESCAPGFPLTLDCERVLAGGVSKWGSQIKVRRRRREPGGRPEMLPGTAVGDGFRPGASARRCGVCCAARILSPCRGSWGSRRRGPRRGGISFWPQARPA